MENFIFCAVVEEMLRKNVTKFGNFFFYEKRYSKWEMESAKNDRFHTLTFSLPVPCWMGDDTGLNRNISKTIGVNGKRFLK